MPWREARTWPFFLATAVWSHEVSEVARDFHQQRRNRIPPGNPEMGRTLTSPFLGCLTVSGVFYLWMELSNKMSAFSEKKYVFISDVMFWVLLLKNPAFSKLSKEFLERTATLYSNFILKYLHILSGKSHYWNILFLNVYQMKVYQLDFRGNTIPYRREGRLLVINQFFRQVRFTLGFNP